MNRNQVVIGQEYLWRKSFGQSPALQTVCVLRDCGFGSGLAVSMGANPTGPLPHATEEDWVFEIQTQEGKKVTTAARNLFEKK